MNISQRRAQREVRLATRAARGERQSFRAVAGGLHARARVVSRDTATEPKKGGACVRAHFWCVHDKKGARPSQGDAA
eukprot:6943445-Prymnesium_polylepis.1